MYIYIYHIKITISQESWLSHIFLTQLFNGAAASGADRGALSSSNCICLMICPSACVTRSSGPTRQLPMETMLWMDIWALDGRARDRKGWKK